MNEESYQFAGRRARVVGLGDLLIAHPEFGDREIVTAGGQLEPVGEPFGDDAVVLGLDAGRTKDAEVDVATVKEHVGLIAATVVSHLREGGEFSCHAWEPKSGASGLSSIRHAAGPPGR